MTALEIRDIAKEKKKSAIRYPFCAEAIKGMISRLFGAAYCARFSVCPIQGPEGHDAYRLSDTADGILLEATSGSAAAAGLRYYLTVCCKSYLGPLTQRLALPEVPPAVGGVVENDSPFLYRYFFNYCTFGYSCAFWDFSEWERFLDWLLLSGYNLILNPIGNELVFFRTLLRLGYTEKEARAFLSAPVFYPWQSMLNLSGYGGAAPQAFYEERARLSRAVTERLNAFGAEVVLPGYSGIVPDDFSAHFPESRILMQGGWCNTHRPSLVHYEDPLFTRIAGTYYEEQKALLGDGHAYFSVDPFHEGGNADGVDMAAYGRACYRAMQTAEANAVWVLQGWTTNPSRALLSALPADGALIANLKSEVNVDGGDNFANRPWMYGCVNNFGGRRVLRANLQSQYRGPHAAHKDPHLSAVGIAMLPEGVECDEIAFDIFSEIAFRRELPDFDSFLREYISNRYGTASEALCDAWRLLCRDVYLCDTSMTPRESPFATRPTLRARMVTPACGTDAYTYHPEVLLPILSLLLSKKEELRDCVPYRFDLYEILRQLVALTSWGVLREMEAAFEAKDKAAFLCAKEDFFRLFSYQSRLMAESPAKGLPEQLEAAARHGKSDEEKVYFTRILKTLYTAWGDASSGEILHDYSAREERGMIECFYRPRWERYLSAIEARFQDSMDAFDAEYPYYEEEMHFCHTETVFPEAEEMPPLDEAAVTEDCAALLARQEIQVTGLRQKNAMELSESAQFYRRSARTLRALLL